MLFYIRFEIAAPIARACDAVLEGIDHIATMCDATGAQLPSHIDARLQF